MLSEKQKSENRNFTVPKVEGLWKNKRGLNIFAFDWVAERPFGFCFLGRSIEVDFSSTQGATYGVVFWVNYFHEKKEIEIKIKK